MNTLLPLIHPQADAISIVAEPHDSNTVEVAFFKNNTWVIDPIDNWDEEPDCEFGESATLVYRYVPVASLTVFLHRYLA